jgi:2-aminoadipate transaminase
MLMSAAPFDFTSAFRPGLPAPAVKFAGFPKYNFVGGHNHPDHIPVDGLIKAAASVLKREGATLATYGLQSGALGYRPLREFLSKKLKGYGGITAGPDEILITSGSGGGLDFVANVLAAPGDTVLVEQETYGGALTRLARFGLKPVGVPLDAEGLRPDALASTLDRLKRDGIRARYIYTIPTVQNPTGAIMSEARRAEILKVAQAHGIPILEDECYSDLIWDGQRPPAMYAMSKTGGVIHVGSFSKSIAPAVRIGYVVAGWDVLSRMLALKTDGGTGALDQMILAEFCASEFSRHVTKLNTGLKAKLDTLTEALAENFGTAAEFVVPKGGIFLWVKLPDTVDTKKLYQTALAAGVAINPGPEWSTNTECSSSRLRLCFANPSHAAIREGVAALAEVCRRDFGVPAQIANVKHA